MLKSPRFWIGILISLICLYFAFQGIKFDQLLDALVGINYFWIVVASLVFLVSFAMRVLRWQILFSPLRLRTVNVFHALNVGYLLSNILPARLGDVARAYLIGELEDVSKARALSTVVVERLSDGLTVVLLLSVTALFVPNIPEQAQQGAVATAIAGIAGITFLLVLSFNKERGLSLLHRLVAPIKPLQHPKLWEILESLIDGFAVLRSPKAVLGVGVFAVLAWVLGGLTFWITSLATNSNIPVTAAFLVMTATSLMVVIPSSPGYVGVFHAGAVFLLTTVFKVDQTIALSYAIVIHALMYIWIIILGAFSMWREGISMSSLQKMQVPETK
ncbi:MAG: flippase-like domain-containing protein [Chloroflexi bacterium]|nr:flippase-like domain-containing protein [Chloroflexota bacterium]